MDLFKSLVIVALLLIPFVFSGFVRSSSEDRVDRMNFPIKFYWQVNKHGSKDLLTIALDGIPGGDWTYLVPVGTTDTLRVWAEHYGPFDDPVSKSALIADMVVTCYPNFILDKRIRERHVFPNMNGYIWTYEFKDRLVLITTLSERTLYLADKNGVIKWPSGFQNVLKR